MTSYEVTGTYRRCPTCEAPIVDPMPDTWTVDLIKEGPPEGPVESFITPHAEQCDAPKAEPRPGVSVRVPAGRISDLTIDFGGPPFRTRRALLGLGPGFLFYAPVGAPVGGWTSIGYTDAGMVSDDGVTWEYPGPPPDLHAEDPDDPTLRPHRPGEAQQ